MSGNYWINWQEYTGLEFFFYGVGCLLWVVAYAIYIRNIIRLKYVEMPVFAGCCDVAWEFVWSFLAWNNMLIGFGQQVQRRAHGPAGIVFVRSRITEVDEQAVANGVAERPFVPPRDGRHQRPQLHHRFVQRFGIERAATVAISTRGVGDLAAQHSDLPAFAARQRRRAHRSRGLTRCHRNVRRIARCREVRHSSSTAQCAIGYPRALDPLQYG